MSSIPRILLHRVLFSITATPLLLMASGVAHAAPCTNMQINLTSSSLNLSTSSSTVGTVRVTANTQPGGCSFYVTANYGTASSYSTRALRMNSNAWPYQIDKDSSLSHPLKANQDATSNNDVLNGVMPANKGQAFEVDINFWVNLDVSNPWLRFGNYNDNLTLSLYQGNVGSGTKISDINLGLNFNAPKRADIAIEQSGGSFALGDTVRTLNFGALTSGTSQSCDIVVKTNSGYMVTASSANNGRLKHASLNSYIPYTLNVSGGTINLSGSASSPVQIARVLGVSPASGFVLPTQVTIGTFGVVPVGTYADIITLTVQSSE
jgi:hypothetical protein